MILLRLFESHKLVRGEHENVVAATLVKMSGDLVFWQKGGLGLNDVSEHG